VSTHPNAVETMNRVARSLGGAAHVAYLSRELIAQERDLAELAVEVSQLLDVLAGVFVTNPEERIHAHIHAIDRMMADLAPIDPGERHGP